MRQLMEKLDALERRNKQLEPWARIWGKALDHFADLIREGLPDPNRYCLRKGVLDPGMFPVLTLELAHIPGRIYFVASMGCVDEDGNLGLGEGFIQYGSDSVLLYQTHTSDGEGPWFVADLDRATEDIPVEEGLERALLSLITGE